MAEDEPSINDLINQLKRIRLEEARVIEQLELASAREEQARRAERIRAAQATRAELARATARVGSNVFQPGDRIRITNGVKAGQLSTGVVTKVGVDRVSVTTDDGTNTWRAPKNLTIWF